MLNVTDKELHVGLKIMVPSNLAAEMLIKSQGK